MKIEVKCIPGPQWIDSFSEFAHRICFGEIRPSAKERVDYALLGVCSATQTPLGYMTCRELDSTTVYWQFGGAFPSGEKSWRVWEGYKSFAEWHIGRYERVLTYIGNENTAMLKIAMRLGFRIIGVKLHEGKVLVEHELKLEQVLPSPPL